MRVKLTTDRGATDYKRFAWTRCKAQYEIVGAPPVANAGLLELYPDLKLPFLKPLASTADLQEYYYPLEDAPGISRKFAQLRTVEGVLQFANTYGLLRLEEVRRVEGHRKEIEKVGEGVNLWLGEAMQFAHVYSVWDAVNSRCDRHPARAATNCRGCASVTERELRKIIRWQRPNFVTVRFPDAEHVIASNARNTSWFGKWKPGEVLGPAKLYLIEQYNTNMSGSASPMLLLNAKGEMRPHLSTTSLLGALWIEFGGVVSGAVRQVACESCGKVMDVTGLRSDKRKHDKCVLREKMARYRSAKRETENGKTKTR